MRFGLRQLNQGLASNVFRAEEFNSIVENMPEVSARLAKGFGVTQGQLRNMVLDGKVLSRDVFENLRGQSADINAEFQEIPESIRRAGQSVETSIGQALVKINKSLDLTGTLAKALTGVADFVTDITTTDAAELVEDIKEKSEELEAVEERIAETVERVGRARGIALGAAKGQLAGLQQDARDLEATIVALEARLNAAKADERVDDTPGGGGNGETDDAKKKRERAIASAEKLFGELEVLKLRELDDDAALEQLRFDRKQAQLDAQLEQLRENKALTVEIEAEFDEAQKDLDIARLAAAQERQDEADAKRLAGMRVVFGEMADEVIFLQDLKQKTAKQEATFVFNQALQLTEGLAQTSKKAFKVNKALALTQATVRTAAAVMGALADVPFPANLVAAALVGGMGAQQIAQIQATEFGGGAARGSGSLSGVPSLAGGGPQGAPQDIDIPEIRQNEAREQTLRIEFVGTGDEVTRVLMASMTAKIVETDAILIPSDSRNALELLDP